MSGPELASPGGGLASLGQLLEAVDMHAAGSDLTRDEAVADLVVAGIFRFYGAGGFPRSALNPDGYDAAELASYEGRGVKLMGSARGWELASSRTSSPELASSVPEPASSSALLARLRGAQQDAMRHAAPAPADPCEECGPGSGGTDATWASMARATRDACSLLGWPILARCMPGEEQECGHGFAAHTVAHLATLIGIAEHQLQHLEPPAGMAEQLVQHTLNELARRDAARALRLARGVLPG